MAAVPYLQRGPVRALIFGSFFLLTLPVAAFIGAHPGDKNASVMAPVQVYFVALGVTHFVLTFAVYLSAENRAHFVSSPLNVLAFWVLPLVPFLVLAAWFGFALNERFIAATAVIGIVIRTLDFQHVARQSFGVLQLMKGRDRSALPSWAPRLENAHFLALTALLVWTFVNASKLPLDSPVTFAGVVVSAGLFVSMVAMYARAMIRTPGSRRTLALGLLYACMQTLGLVLAMYKLAFYAAALAIHYVEYHLVMGRRVLKVPAGASDNLLALVQRRPLVLYAGVLVLSAAWFGIGRLQQGFDDGPIAQRTLVHLFDGLFVFHYVIEMSIWKLSVPYFRKSVGPLFA
jgi:hypothetical protein